MIVAARNNWFSNDPDSYRNQFVRWLCDINIDEKCFNVEYRAYDSINETLTVRLENGDMVIVSSDLANWSTPLQDNQNIRVVSGNQQRSMRFIFNNNEDGIYFVRLNESFLSHIGALSDTFVHCMSRTNIPCSDHSRKGYRRYIRSWHPKGIRQL